MPADGATSLPRVWHPVDERLRRLGVLAGRSGPGQPAKARHHPVWVRTDSDQGASMSVQAPDGWGRDLGADRKERSMSDTDIDELGPVDYLVVEFPAGKSNFTGEMAAELASLVDSGIVRVLDLLILHKADDGTVEAFEIDDLDEVDELRALEGEIAEILAAEDVAHLAAAMENGSTAGVLVWENSWAAPFASAARRAGGQLIASGRIPIQGILASLEAEDASMSEGA
jgi:hypothetical protein